ncbi:hypothetical protein [Diaphorobacter nitroreducens]|uniref:hypothetical protein n=1 Tax=Diaphorobacter nitroreducens TaxID=164759 RepID=UPI00289BA56F|nr:hypothetical protein [Diaphorobacter nitroreducens]
MPDFIKARVALISVGVFSSSAPAFAELTPEAAAEIANYSADTIAAILLIIFAGVSIWALRKLGNYFGWF